jgi:hypothetical protein
MLCEQFRNTLKLAKMIYIYILYLKYLETYLETLHSHFQPNCHFKMFTNSGSGEDTKDWTYVCIMYTVGQETPDSVSERNHIGPGIGKETVNCVMYRKQSSVYVQDQKQMPCIGEETECRE